jgi:beta-phosphoglucomutase
LTIIEELEANGFKLAVGSSGPRENVELLVNSLNLLEKFSVLITAAEIENGKPAPDVFLSAAEKVNVKPENCIVVEDAPVGIEAARRAEMKSIALTTTHNEKELLDADLIVKDLSYIDIKDIFKLLEIEVE